MGNNFFKDVESLHTSKFRRFKDVISSHSRNIIAGWMIASINDTINVEGVAKKKWTNIFRHCKPCFQPLVSF